MKRTALLFSLLLLTAVALAGEDAKPADHGFIAAADVQWAAAPPSLPPGAKMALMEGNPAEEGIFTIRISAPAGYRIAPHWHPAYEHLTVISGEVNMGLGETFDKAKGHKLAVGSFAWMKPGTRHSFWTEVETVVQIHGMGPWQLYYVNPADDPRNAAKK